jgi:hypothetical protein
MYVYFALIDAACERHAMIAHRAVELLELFNLGESMKCTPCNSDAGTVAHNVGVPPALLVCGTW